MDSRRHCLSVHVSSSGSFGAAAALMMDFVLMSGQDFGGSVFLLGYAILQGLSVISIKTSI